MDALLSVVLCIALFYIYQYQNVACNRGNGYFCPALVCLKIYSFDGDRSDIPFILVFWSILNGYEPVHSDSHVPIEINLCTSSQQFLLFDDNI